MKYAVAAAALVAAVSAQSSGGCVDSVPYTFEFSPANVSESVGTAKRDTLERRVAACSKNPIVVLQNGVLHDQDNRQGEIVSNTQFQFDNPLQPGRKYDSGFCINGNNTLSIGGSAIFYSCISGDFSNLYTTDIGSVCSQVYLITAECVGGVSSGSSSLSSASASETGSSTAASTPSTPASTPSSTPTSTVVTTPVNTPTAAPAPYPVGNSTTPAGTASASGSPTTTAGTSSTSPATFQPASGANLLTIGSQLIAGVAAIGAFALF